MKKFHIHTIIILVLLVLGSTIVSATDRHIVGGETSLFRFKNCVTLNVSIMGELVIDEGEYNLVGCNESIVPNTFTNCSCEVSLTTLTNTLNVYEITFTYLTPKKTQSTTTRVIRHRSSDSYFPTNTTTNETVEGGNGGNITNESTQPQEQPQNNPIVEISPPDVPINATTPNEKKRSWFWIIALIVSLILLSIAAYVAYQVFFVDDEEKDKELF